MVPATEYRLTLSPRFVNAPRRRDRCQMMNGSQDSAALVPLQ